MAIDRINPSDVIVTTTDLHENYTIIGPVYIQVNNRSNQFQELYTKYSSLVDKLQRSGQRSNDTISGLEIMQMLFLNVGVYNGHANFDAAFFIAVEELKKRAASLGADAIIGMRQDIDIDSNGFQFFYLQMYGTAVHTEKHIKEIEKKEFERNKAIEEENRIAQLKKEKAAKAMEVLSSGNINNDLKTFIELCEQFDSVSELEEVWNKFDKTNLSEDQLKCIDNEIENAKKMIRMYGKSSVRIPDLALKIAEFAIAE